MFLSLKIWVPITYLSYGTYLFQYYTLNAPQYIPLGFYPEEADWRENWEKNGCGFSLGKAMGLWLFIFILGGVILTHLFSLFVYVYIEKPSVDARRVFKPIATSNQSKQ